MRGNNSSQDLGPIPPQWRDRVVKILLSDAPGAIQSTAQSIKDWFFLFPSSFRFERYESMANALRVAGIQGRRIYGMREEGETYAFFFHHRNTALYGKINLLPSGKLIIIYSSHKPEKGNKL